MFLLSGWGKLNNLPQVSENSAGAVSVDHWLERRYARVNDAVAARLHGDNLVA